MLSAVRRLVGSANYRLNEKPVRLLPAGSEEYVQAHPKRKVQLAKAAEQMLRHIQWSATTDFTGAGTTDYLILYRYIIERKPAYVLELGSGITTLIMAKALSEVGSGRFVTLDHIAHYSDEARRLLTPQLAELVDFVVSPAIGKIYGGVSALHYREIPSHPYDMIFVDGPSTLVGGTDFPSTDALRVITESKHPADILIDLRVVTVHRYSAWVN